MKTRWCFVFLFSAAAAVAAEKNWGDTIAGAQKKLAETGFKLRKSINDKTGAGEPATFGTTRSRNDSGSTAADIAVGFEKSLPQKDEVNHFIGPMFEYHRNDNGVAPSKEVKNYAAGVVYYWTADRSTWSEILGASLAYKNDRIKNGEGVTASLSGTVQNQDIFLNHVPIANKPGQPFPWGWFPGIAVQAEHGDDLEANKKRGEVYRLKGEFSLVARPIREVPIQVTVGVVGWHNFHKTGPFERYHRDQKLFRWTLDYFINPDVSVGLTHLDGANPETNYKGDRQTTFGLKVKI
ncbi:MAG: hypothetical protein HZC55_01130 [Verrucomicrobia bacterium]|nr:hypothetical protein [Verrucomicrobiota bacterium]